MPKTLNDALAITVNVKWLIGIIILLMGIASSSGVLLYEIGELHTEVYGMRAEQAKNREAIISLTATLQGQGVIK